MFGLNLAFAATSMFAVSYAVPTNYDVTTLTQLPGPLCQFLEHKDTNIHAELCLGGRSTPHPILAARDNYVNFGGDGSMAAGWPKQDEWMPFDEAWAANLNHLQNSCRNNGWAENNDESELQAIKSSIVAESTSSQIPKEFILAVMMQETGGCVRAPTTTFQLPSPGLMQSGGTASCAGVTPCPADKIQAMIHEGTAGEGLRMSLKFALDSFADVADSSKWYKAARQYNAGQYATGLNLGVSSTPCYASDVTNRLLTPGVSSTCIGTHIASLKISEGREGGEKDDDDVVPAPADDAASYDIIPGTARDCKKYYAVRQGEDCRSIPVDFATLRLFNPQLNDICTNLWAGYRYCVEV